MAKAAKRNLIRDYALALTGAVLIAVLFRVYVLEAFRMPSRAMSPAVEPGDTIFVKKWVTAFGGRFASLIGESGEPAYGDVVVFRFPGEDRTYIKRVVGRPGDNVELVNGILSIGGAPVTRFRTPDELCGQESLPSGKVYTVCREKPVLTMNEKVSLKPDEYFVVGDFRAITPDLKRTRAYGVIHRTDVIGRAALIWLSFTQDTTGFRTIRFERMFRTIQ